MSKQDHAAVAPIRKRLLMLAINLNELKKLKKTTEVRKKITNLIARIQRNRRWIKELNEIT
jgi:hypothetical protein